MFKLLVVAAGPLLLLYIGEAAGATVTNLGKVPQTLSIAEGSNQTELTVNPGETVEFCQAGCFLKLPNGDRGTLTGVESVEISRGRTTIK